MIRTRKRDILDTIGQTPLVELTRLSPRPQVRLFAKLEGNNPTGSVKDRVAMYMVEEAEERGELAPGQVILEPTSGNTGISLAMIGCRRGYRVTVVMPENVSQERVQLLRAYGAEIVFSDPDEGTNGSILKAQEMAEREPGYYMPFQYASEANPRAHYETTGREVLEELPEVTGFVAGLGTGGTLMGVGRRLKEHNPDIKVVAVAPPADDRIQGLRSLEEGYVPPILDLGRLDTRIMIESREAFYWTKQLLLQEGIFAGISSGAAIACARRVAERMEEGNLVCLLADGGWKYLSTGLWNRDYDAMEQEVTGKIWW